MAIMHRFRHLRHEGVRSWVEDTEGQRALSFVHGWVRGAMAMAGALRAGAAFPAFATTMFGSLTPEQVTACLERLVEVGVLLELTPLDLKDADRVFVWETPPEPPRHLQRVIVLTALKHAGKPVTLDSLCTRTEGERDQVREIVLELAQLGKVTFDGDFVGLHAPEAPQGDSWRGATVLGPGGWKGRDV